MKGHPMCGGHVRVLARCFPKNHCAHALPRLYTAVKAVKRGRHFSSSRASMTAQKIDGTAIAKTIRERLGAKIKERQAANPRYQPSLKIVQGESDSHCAA